MQVHGNINGLSAAQVKNLEKLYRKRVPFEVMSTPELSRTLGSFSHETGRQIGVIVDRKGSVHFVVVGDATKLWLPDIGRLRAAEGRLRGLRLIHTHLHNEPLTRDDIVDLTRLRLDMVIALCLSPGEPRPMWVYYGHNVPSPPGTQEPPYRTFGPLPYSKLDVDPSKIVLAIEEEYARETKAREIHAKDGRAILVHVYKRAGRESLDNKRKAEISMRELEELARTAGVQVVETIIQGRENIDRKYVVGPGKLDDISIAGMQLDAEVLIFDRELSPAQAAEISAATDMKVIDRTQLILDIFAQRAESRDGKLQVELAQMKYLLPRLGRTELALSRLTGGIGGRGPGETKLEIGKRRANERIDRLKKDLKKLEKQRGQRRRARSKEPTVAIIGYTNAGKSTLLNALSGSDVLAEDKLFATLDTRSRRVYLPDLGEVVMTDTVGFIRDLPRDLFAAFKATFEEASYADLLLHVIDVADSDFDAQLEATETLMLKLGIEDMPCIKVLNKVDQVADDIAQDRRERLGGLLVSAQKKTGFTELKSQVATKLRSAIKNRNAPRTRSDLPFCP